MSQRVTFDHIGVAVHDAVSVLGTLVNELGATLIIGEKVPGFKYAVAHIGSAHAGMNFEVLEPWQPDEFDFLKRFLEDHGEGPHHLSFVVPNLPDALGQLRAAELPVTRINLEWAAWQEAFILPCAGHGTVVQVGATDIGFPPMEEMMHAAREGKLLPLPLQQYGRDRMWWYGPEPIIDPAELECVVLGTPNLRGAKELFGGILGGSDDAHGAGWVEYTWDNGSHLRIIESSEAGVRGVVVKGLEHPCVIGGTRMGSHAEIDSPAG